MNTWAKIDNYSNKEIEILFKLYEKSLQRKSQGSTEVHLDALKQAKLKTAEWINDNIEDDEEKKAKILDLEAKANMLFATNKIASCAETNYAGKINGVIDLLPKITAYYNDIHTEVTTKYTEKSKENYQQILSIIPEQLKPAIELDKILLANKDQPYDNIIKAILDGLEQHRQSNTNPDLTQVYEDTLEDAKLEYSDDKLKESFHEILGIIPTDIKAAIKIDDIIDNDHGDYPHAEKISQVIAELNKLNATVKKRTR